MGIYTKLLKEQYITEMVTKKQAMNPEYAKKVYEKGFESSVEAIEFISSLLSGISGATIGLKISHPLIGITMGVLANGAICSWLETLPAKLRDLKIKEIESKCNTLIEKYTKELESGKGNEKELKSYISRLNNTIDEIKNIENNKIKEADEKAKKEYNKIITYLNGNPSSDNSSGHLELPILTMIKMKLSDKQICDYIISTKKNRLCTDKNTIGLKDYCLDCIASDGYIYSFLENDDYICIIDAKKKVFVDDALINKNRKNINLMSLTSGFNSEIDDKLIQLDKEEGYYLFSQPPKGIKRKSLKIYDFK